jgi:molybdopterin synthase sulfur carrier subunit
VRVQLRYFASIRETVGRREEEIDAPDGATVAAVWSQLLARYPSLAGQRYRPALNQEYVSEQAVLRDGDEVVFVPPVSGGSPGRKTLRSAQGQAPDEGRMHPSFVFRLSSDKASH